MTTTMMRVTGIDAVYYMTKDLERATKFYADLLGLEPTMHAPNFVSEWTFANGETFGLYMLPENEPLNSSGGVMFAVDDVAAYVAAAKARGVTFSDEGAVADTPVCHMAFGEDGEGNRFILHHRK
jgi:catechol 2,3-dioxygenase-like lactoylglutathione lyase family enzyme